MENGKKRGRKRDDTLPPSRSREIQRAFRARKAEYVSDLENKVNRLTQENAELRLRLGDSPRPATPDHALARTEETTATSREESLRERLDAHSDYSSNAARISNGRPAIVDDSSRQPWSDHSSHAQLAHPQSAHPTAHPQAITHALAHPHALAHSRLPNRPPIYPSAFSPTTTAPNNYSPVPLQLAPIETRHYAPTPPQHHIYTISPVTAPNGYDQYPSYSRQQAALPSPPVHPLHSLIHHPTPPSSSNDLKSILQPSHLLNELIDHTPDLITRTLPLRGDSPTPETEIVFLETCCAVPSQNAALHPSSPHPHPDESSPGYKSFCKALMRGLELTGKGCSGRTSYSNEEVRKLIAKTEAEQCCGGVVDCTGLFEDELNQASANLINGGGGGGEAIPEGYLTALHAWRLMRPLIDSDPRLSPSVVAEMILDSGQPRAPHSPHSSTSSSSNHPRVRRRSSQHSLHAESNNVPQEEEEEKFVSTNIRCERYHGLLIIGGIVDGVMRVLQSGFMDLARGR